ncbi:pseudaminic acid synthase [Elioraea rosea]|uniref:pseudaminic acid synthase n=1 Tax=Elioraea rosea TaxID=2492390 RepID=UPI0011824C38|nr:pseudaminic acid synthase [Elioraea rosea]
MSAFAIAGRPIGPGCPPYVIAELSGNHNGELSRALALVDAAAQAGADAIKLQTYTADTITLDSDAPDFMITKGPWAGRRMHDLYREAHTPWDWHPALFARARDHGLACFSTPFDTTAIDFLQTLDPPAWKISSFELVDLPLIEAVARAGGPMIMSTGMATLGEIEAAVGAARRGGCTQLMLLWCVSGYPTPAVEANLLTLTSLSAAFGVPVGLSDHTMGVAVPVAAVTLGAVAIEKHLTLARADGGPDAGFSLEPGEFALMAQAVREAAAAVGRVSYELKPSETPSRPFRRSLYAVADIASGERLTAENVRSIRPGNGLAPRHLPHVLGRRARLPIARGTPIAWSLIGPEEP